MSKFYIFSSILALSLGVQVGYLLLHVKESKPMLEFVKFTSLTSPSFYSNTPLLRHRDLNHVDGIFSSHPALKESKFGTFILKSPVK